MCSEMPPVPAPPCSDAAALHWPSALSRSAAASFFPENTLQPGWLRAVSGLNVTLFKLRSAEQALSETARTLLTRRLALNRAISPPAPSSAYSCTPDFAPRPPYDQQFSCAAGAAHWTSANRRD